MLLLAIGCAPPAVETPTEVAQNSAPEVNEPAHPKGFVSARINQLADLKSVEVTLGGKKHQLFLMDDEGKRQEGMMFLHTEDVREDQGMLFVFPTTQKDDGNHGFWMRNCPLALDIIYVDSKQKVLSVGKGDPFNETPISPKGDYNYVVELKQGCAAKLGIKVGALLDLPKDLKSQ